MAQFLGDIASMLELVAIAWGLTLLHRASKEAPAPLLKIAGGLLIAGGLIAASCTIWFWMHYKSAGMFDAI